MNKRGQVTLFVILGVLIIILVGLGIFFRGEIADLATRGAEAIRFSDEEQDIRSVIQQCLDDSLQNGLFLAQKQSGHIYITQNFLEFEGVRVPYIYERGLQVVTVPELQTEFQRYIAQELELCSQVLDADFESVSSRVAITNEGVSAEVIYPFTVTVAESSIRNEFPYDSGVEAAELIPFIQIMREVATATERDVDAIPIGVLVEQETFIATTVPEETEVLYSLETTAEPAETYFFATSQL